jgi:hypothetical protein
LAIIGEAGHGLGGTTLQGNLNLFDARMSKLTMNKTFPRTLWIVEEFGPMPDGFAIPFDLITIHSGAVRNREHRFISSETVTAGEAAKLADALAKLDLHTLGMRATLYLFADEAGETFKEFVLFLREGAFVIREAPPKNGSGLEKPTVI